MSSVWWIGHWHYGLIVVLLCMGLYILMSRDNLVKKMMGLNIFQVAVILFYVSMAKISGGTAPIFVGGGEHGEHGEHAAQVAEVLYSNPIPHVLMLTAIVVGVATMALGLSLVVRIQEAYGTVEEDEILDLDLREDGL